MSAAPVDAVRSAARKAGLHVGVLAAFAALAVAYSWPVARTFGTRYIGPGGDNPLFVWNLWHFRYALHVLRANPLWCDFLYWPHGANMIGQHYSLAHDLLGYFLQDRIGLPATYNALMLLNYVLAGYGVWLMARDWGADGASAFVAGAAYAFSTANTYSLFVGLGFDNQSVHVLPFFVWTLARAVRGRRLADAVLCALALTWVWTCNIYYFLFCLLLPPLFFAVLERPLELGARRREPGPVLRWTARALDAGLLAAGALVLASLGRQREFHGRGSLREIGLYAAPYLAFWALLAARLAAAWSVRARLRLEALSLERLKPYAAVLACWTALNWPVIWASLSFLRTADYGTTANPLRGGGNPVDPLWLLVNESNNFLWGRPLAALIARLPFGVPSVGALGLVPLAAAAWLWRRRPSDPWTRLWFAGAAFSALVTMGPWLKVFGVHAYLPLPFYALHLLPVFNNLQHGLQFTKFAALFLALILAAALTELRRGLPRAEAALAGALALALVGLESFPRAVPTLPAAVSPLLTRLGPRPDGALLPVPMGAVFNGLSGQGAIGALWLLPSDQAAFRKPIVGGYLGRASPRVQRLMTSDALLAPLLAAQSGGEVAPRLRDPAFVGRWLAQTRVRYVLVDRGLAPAALARAVAVDWPVRRIDAEGPLELYEARLLYSSPASAPAP